MGMEKCKWAIEIVIMRAIFELNLFQKKLNSFQ